MEGIPAIIKVGGWHGGTAPTVSKIVEVGAMPPCLPCHASSRRFIICVPRNISDKEVLIKALEQESLLSFEEELEQAISTAHTENVSAWIEAIAHYIRGKQRKD